MAKSLKVNFLLNLLYTTSGAIFPLITFPYASRIMGPEGIGIINFDYSIISYVMLFAVLGTPMYGVRETARLRHDPEALRRMAQSLLVITGILNIFAYIAVAILLVSIPQIAEHQGVFLILSGTIILYSFGCEWFFQGIEDFKYITIRGLVIRTLSLAILFIFVRSKEDLEWYALYTSFAVGGNSIFNFFHLRKYGIFSHFRFSELEVRKHFRPVFRVFLLTVMLSVYLHLAKIILGFLHNNSDVGIFVAANKVIDVVLTFIVAFTFVLCPRLSNLAENEQKEDFKRIAQQALDFLICMTLPLSVGIILLAPEIIFLLSGAEYIASIPTLRILALSIPFIALSNLFGQQVLYALGKENLVLRCMVGGVTVSLITNFLWVPAYHYIGTAWAMVVVEIVIFIALFITSRPHFRSQILSRNNLRTLLATIGMGGVCWLIAPHFGKITILLTPIVGISVYIFILWAMHHPLVAEALKLVQSWVPQKH